MDDRREPGGDVGIERENRDRLFRDDPVEHRVQGLAREGFRERQELVEDSTCSEDVGARRRGLAHGLLRGHVVWRAEDDPSLGDGLAGVHAGEPEVEDLDSSCRRHDDVGRLDVSVDDAAAVGVAQAVADVGQHANPVGEGNRGASLHQTPDVVSLEQLHRHVELAVDAPEVVDLHDVRVIEPADRLGLALEALMLLGGLPSLRSEHLERHDAAERCVAGAIHDTPLRLPRALRGSRSDRSSEWLRSRNPPRPVTSGARREVAEPRRLPGARSPWLKPFRGGDGGRRS